MDSEAYMLFMQRFTLKLAETFKELNEMCTAQVELMKAARESSSQRAEEMKDDIKQIEIVQKADEEDYSSESAKVSEEKKEKKTKKIKKQYQKDQDKGADYSKKEEGQVKQPKKKIKKISHKPKAPASSFLLFFKEQQPSIAKSYPTYGVTELTKVAAKCWNELSAEEKEPYIKLCDEERRLYQERMTRYRLEFPQEIAEKEKDRKNIKKQKKAALALIKQSPKKQKIEKEEQTIQRNIDSNQSYFNASSLLPNLEKINQKNGKTAQNQIELEQISQSGSIVDQFADDSLGIDL